MAIKFFMSLPFVATTVTDFRKQMGTVQATMKTPHPLQQRAASGHTACGRNVFQSR
jgi:hypothetical protein